MARIRTVKPELPHDPTLNKCSREARLTFVYLITIADDLGYFRFSLGYLNGALFPDDALTPETLKGWLVELNRAGLIERIDLPNGTSVGRLKGWEKHQRIDNAGKSFLRGEIERFRGDDDAPQTGTAVVPVSQAVETVKASTVKRKVTEKALALAARVVFTYWAARFGHDRAVFDRKRQARIEARLRENGGDVSELLSAVDGALRDDFITGRDPKAKRAYDGIEVIFRDRAQIERFASAAPKVPEGAQHPFLIQYEVEHGRAE